MSQHHPGWAITISLEPTFEVRDRCGLSTSTRKMILMNHYSGNETVNAGTGKELTIKALTELVAKVVGYEDFLHNPMQAER